MDKSKALGLIGCGIFFCLILEELSYLVSFIIEDLLISSSLTPIYIYSFSKYLSLIFVLSTYILSIKRFFKLDISSKKKVRNLFLITFFGYLTTQFIAFFYPFLESENQMFLNLKNAYLLEIKNNYFIKILLIDSPIWIFKYLIIFIFIIRKLNPNKY